MRIDGRRIVKPLAVFVVTACAFIAGHSAPRLRIDPGLARLGGGFVSDTAKVNGTTLHSVRGATGPQEKTAIVFGQNIRSAAAIRDGRAGESHARSRKDLALGV